MMTDRSGPEKKLDGQADQPQTPSSKRESDTELTVSSDHDPVGSLSDPETVSITPDQGLNDSGATVPVSPKQDQLQGSQQSATETIGKYRLVLKLGQGGMGVVYKAIDPIIKRNVALKVMIVAEQEGTDYSSRFLREAEAIGQLNHPNIVTIHDAGFHQNNPYLVMEYLDGQDLSKIMAHDHLPEINQVLDIFIAICRALQYSHQRGIVHRDIKPANIFLTRDGTAKLMDFGIAKIEDSKLTRTGMLVGTLQYMSPEQIDGKNVDHRTDIYSMGVVMYEVFSRKLPYSGQTLSELIKNTLLNEPEPFEPFDLDLPPLLTSVIMKCLAKKKEDRYRDMNQMVEALLLVKEYGKRQDVVVSGQPDPDLSSEKLTAATHHGRVTRPFLPQQTGPDETAPTPSAAKKNPRRSVVLLSLLILGTLIIFMIWKGYGQKLEGKPTPSADTRTEQVRPDSTQAREAIEPVGQPSVKSAWEHALQADTIAAYEQFITDFDQEQYAHEYIDQARNRIRAKQQDQPAAKDEAQAGLANIQQQWRNARALDTREAYLEFIAKFGDDPRADREVSLARTGLESILLKQRDLIKDRITSGQAMVLVRGDTFQMGDTFGTGDQDETAHQVSLGDFVMAQHEVTFLEYDEFCRATDRTGPDDKGFGRDLQPVINVTWFDAINYCNWLSQRRGLTPCYSMSPSEPPEVTCDFSADGFRLPTEAEWEFAARIRGTKVLFSNGSNIADRNSMHYNNRHMTDTNKTGPNPVGLLGPNALELYDLSGNVWEWCWDWYGPYPTSPVTDPKGPENGTKKVIRGGSWYNLDASYLRTSNRSSASPATQGHDIGFRLVRR
ncbi:SUMF1/EgtB/PvdO family nonheme iron enzyme [bacterium]|nr:SUMF1/EgtB/PvdO family nonheme iron enzyme [bacterium]